MKQTLQAYSKAVPEATYQGIAKKMREESFKLFLIGLVSLPDMFDERSETLNAKTDHRRRPMLKSLA